MTQLIKLLLVQFPQLIHLSRLSQCLPLALVDELLRIVLVQFTDPPEKLSFSKIAFYQR
jgi:hypothetical protein